LSIEKLLIKPFLEAAAGQDENIYSYYVVPVDARYLLEFEFVAAPDLNGSPYLFQAQTRERNNSIKESVSLLRDQKNCMDSAADKWIEASSVELLASPSLLPRPISKDVIEYTQQNRNTE
jgi:hypothetical protein